VVGASLLRDRGRIHPEYRYLPDTNQQLKRLKKKPLFCLAAGSARISLIWAISPPLPAARTGHFSLVGAFSRLLTAYRNADIRRRARGR
jgi:hypothetical protein